jgi:transcriptional regulator GlxA family with amidase domain
VFLFDGYSDWEISYLTPEIAKDERFDLVYFSETGNEVTSMGGLQVIPNTSPDNLKTEEVKLLILPGGVAWEKREKRNNNDAHTEAARFAQANNLPVGSAQTKISHVPFVNTLCL